MEMIVDREEQCKHGTHREVYLVNEHSAYLDPQIKIYTFEIILIQNIYSYT